MKTLYLQMWYGRSRGYADCRTLELVPDSDSVVEELTDWDSGVEYVKESVSKCGLVEPA